MAIPDNAAPEKIIDALNRLFYIYTPDILNQIQGLDIYPDDSLEVFAQKIKNWCKNHPEVEEKIENEISELGLSNAKKKPTAETEEKKRECYEKYIENVNRLRENSEDNKQS